MKIDIPFVAEPKDWKERLKVYFTKNITWKGRKLDLYLLQQIEEAMQGFIKIKVGEIHTSEIGDSIFLTNVYIEENLQGIPERVISAFESLKNKIQRIILSGTRGDLEDLIRKIEIIKNIARVLQEIQEKYGKEIVDMILRYAFVRAWEEYQAELRELYPDYTEFELYQMLTKEAMSFIYNNPLRFLRKLDSILSSFQKVPTEMIEVMSDYLAASKISETIERSAAMIFRKLSSISGTIGIIAFLSLLDLFI